jgi:heme exporter protein CcmD
MAHWQVIAIAYGLTFLALAVEVALLVRRRRAALRQLRLLDEAKEAEDL